MVAAFVRRPSVLAPHHASRVADEIYQAYVSSLWSSIPSRGKRRFARCMAALAQPSLTAGRTAANFWRNGNTRLPEARTTEFFGGNDAEGTHDGRGRGLQHQRLSPARGRAL